MRHFKPIIPLMPTYEREYRRNQKRWAAYHQKQLALTITVTVLAVIGAGLLIWQITQAAPHYWIVYLGMALVIPLLARVGYKVLRYM